MELCQKYSGLEDSNHVNHLGTLGTGNHFIEVFFDDGVNLTGQDLLR